MQTTTGLLLIGHGTRHPAGLAEFRTLADMVAGAVAPQPVEAGFIELAEPTIGDAVVRLVQRGVQKIRVIPLLLFAAGHAKSDVPQAIRRAANTYPGITLEILEPFGLDNQILALSRRRYVEALADCGAKASKETYWLLVGRGSSDADARAEIAQLSAAQARRLGLEWFGHCFVAAASPTLDEGIAGAVEMVAVGVKRIVVQPHLLFRGAVLDEVRAAVAHKQSLHPDIDWITTAHLGPEQELVEAVLRRAR